jgi:sec-independent protein translocase protein TatC
MRKFFGFLWKIITAPFRFVGWLASLPFRFFRFLNSEPESHSLGEIVTSITQEKAAREALIDNIENFRIHLFWIVGWLALGIIVSASFTHQISLILMEPLQKNPELMSVELTTIEVTESLSVFMRIALLSGIILAFPFIIFQAWLFAAPGLTSSEKKKFLGGIPFATLLFAAGLVFSYYILMPSALVAMRLVNDYMGYKTQWKPDSYFKFSTGLLFWMGIGFEFPILIWILTSIGVVTPDLLRKQWRMAIVIIAVLAAAITPTVDPVTMFLVMGPLTALYFISIGLSYFAYRKKKETGPA